MFKFFFYVIVFVFLFSTQALAFVEMSSENNMRQNPFIELQHLFSRGDTYFSFSLKDQNWYSGRCFVPYSNSPKASLLFLLPHDFYKDTSSRGPLFPGSPRMWILGSDKPNANEFDTLGPQKEKDILKVLRADPAPKIEQFSHSLVARWQTKGTAIALRHYNSYLIVQKFSLYNSFVSEYCYYFQKVK